jgi:hypothetical protein
MEAFLAGESGEAGHYQPAMIAKLTDMVMVRNRDRIAMQ